MRSAAGSAKRSRRAQTKTSALRRLDVRDRLGEGFRHEGTNFNIVDRYSLRREITLHFAENVVIAPFDEIDFANILDVGLECLADETELGTGPFGDSLVATSLGPEL